MANNAIENIKTEEGFKGTVYKDTKGFDTLGYGTKMPITEDEAELILIHRFRIMQKELDIALKNKVETRVLNILDEMAYQLGVPKLLTFKKMIKALENKDYLEASKEMIDSEWHKETPARCERLSERVKKIN